MQEKWLYLPIELVPRELDAKLLLAYYATKENYSVILGMQKRLYTNLHLLPEGILLSKGYPKPNVLRRYLFNSKKLGHAFVELDEEGFITNDKIYTRKRTDEQGCKLLDHGYCWGKHQRDLIIKSYPQYQEKFYITGHPRFDLTKPKFRSLQKDEVERIKKEFGDFILVNQFHNSYF